MSREVPEIRYVGANVRRLRTKAGLSQAELAERVELSVVALSRIERGQADIYLSTLVRLAQVLSVKPGRLIEEATLQPAQVGRRPKVKTAKRSRA